MLICILKYIHIYINKTKYSKITGKCNDKANDFSITKIETLHLFHT